MEPYLCYYELHTNEKSFYVHMVIPANSTEEAIAKMPESKWGHGYHLQKKGCYGAMTGQNMSSCMRALHEIGGGVVNPSKDNEHLGYRFFVFPDRDIAQAFIASCYTDVLILSDKSVGNAVRVSVASPGIDRLDERVVAFKGQVLS